MRSNEVLPSIQKKGYSQRTTASIVLGAISIISASMALMMTFALRDQIKEVSGGGGWVFVFGFVVFPLMLISFITSIIGICLSSGTLKGKGLNLGGLMLTFSPILMVFIIMEVENRRKETIMEIENRRKETFNEQNYSYVDGVKFNKEKNELIKYSKNKKHTNYTIPNSVTSIGEGAFYGCSSLTNITIPDGVTSIRHTAFAGCENLTIITIPDSVTTIENLAFQSSKSLMSVTIGSGIMRIGEGVFQNCGNLKTVIFHGDAPKVGKNTFSNWGSASKVATVTIYRKPDAKGWGDTWAGRPVKLISEKP